MEGNARQRDGVKLLVDEMYPRAIAEQLRARGRDAVAVTEVVGLAGLKDAPLLEWAHAERRAIATENVADFLRIHAAYLQSGLRHSGIVLASSATFPRARASTRGALVKALDALLGELQHLDTDVRWLP